MGTFLGEHVDKQFLEMHGNRWRVTVAVPKKLQAKVGKTKLKRTLNTDSLKEANHLKWGVVADLKREMTRLARATPQDELVDLALRMRDADEEHIQIVAETMLGRPTGETEDGSRETYDPKKERQASLYLAIASGRETPFMILLGQWHAQEMNRKERTKGDDRRALGYLEAWCKGSSLKPTLQAITRKVAGRFIADLPSIAVSGRLSGRTTNKYISSLSAYWKFLKKRGEVEENPWTGQTLPKEQRDPDDKERAFTDEEVRKLLDGTPRGKLGAIFRIAALSGARIDAIVSLKVSDCQVQDGEGLFRFKPQKKERAYRHVPIHSDLVGLVEELVRGKAPEDDVFPEYPPVRPGTQQERSMPAVKAFTRYRRSVGVDETRPGLKRALTNFHSFRRWFITEAERAGIPEGTIATVVGHQRPGMEQMRACVEAVRLP